MKFSVTGKEKIYLLFALMLIILLIIFIAQNTNDVLLNFLFWKASNPVSITLAICFFIGLISGITGTIFYMKQKQETETGN
ncbi:MAG: LapA family protein [Candidatus Coatesbacteria bacterium]|nr:LapA family protein [Candidatus Coatesbacteria bacterium]